jgi:hypothetical protein
MLTGLRRFPAGGRWRDGTVPGDRDGGDLARASAVASR